jgi:glycosyltransferase involved in cell wall biosynthesis
LKVSIIIPTYNYAHYIFDALKSIEEQSYPRELIEVIIVDDGSTDQTPQLFKDYNGVLNLKYHYQQNTGKAAATQKGIDLSTGEIIFNLDADDYFYPSKIERLVAIYQQYPEVNYVGHRARLIKNNQDIGVENIPSKILNSVLKGEELILFYLENRLLYGGGSTFSARTKSLKSRIIPSGVNMYIDEYLIYEVALDYQVFICNEALSVWRIHGKNYSVDQQTQRYLKAKNNIDASGAMLAYIKTRTFHQDIIRLYELKHWDRYVNFKEKFESKSLHDYQQTLSFIFSSKYTLEHIKKYRLLNRLIPSFIIKFLKR